IRHLCLAPRHVSAEGRRWVARARTATIPAGEPEPCVTLNRQRRLPPGRPPRPPDREPPDRPPPPERDPPERLPAGRAPTFGADPATAASSGSTGSAAGFGAAAPALPALPATA